MGLENFTTYTEALDENNRATITKHKIDINGLLREDGLRVTKDMNVNHFPNFRHTLKLNLISHVFDTADGILYPWILANVNTGSVYNQDALMLMLYTSVASSFLRIRYGSTGVTDNMTGIADDTILYFKLVRSGTAFYIYIYSDATMKTLLDTLSIVCSNTKYRYIWCPLGKDDDPPSISSMTVDIENLNLHESEGQSSRIVVTKGVIVK